MLACRAALLARCIGLTAALAIAAPVAASAEPALAVVGTEFVLTTAAGRVLRSGDLVGATLNIGKPGSRLRSQSEALRKILLRSADKCSCIISSSRMEPGSSSTCARQMRTGGA